MLFRSSWAPVVSGVNEARAYVHKEIGSSGLVMKVLMIRDRKRGRAVRYNTTEEPMPRNWTTHERTEKESNIEVNNDFSRTLPMSNCEAIAPENILD